MKDKIVNAHNCKKKPTHLDDQYLKKFRIYPYFLYFRLDKWLKYMSSNGWHIVHCGLFFFLFEKGENSLREYFTYGLSTQEGKYDISMKFPSLEKTYGLKRSKINSNKKKSYNIVEIDTNRIDIKNDIGYKELVSDRNRLYARYFIRNLSIVTAVILITSILLLCF